MALKALLFDLDGTVADTDKIHIKVFQELLAPLGIDVTEEFYKSKLSGGLNQVLFKELFPCMCDAEIEQLSAKKELCFRESAANCLVELAGLTPLLQTAKTAGLRLAAVTNAPRLNADFLLDQLNIRHFFETVVLGEECQFGKPHPLPYQTAMKRLHVAPHECIVFEDSITGVTSGIGAGAKVIGILTSQKQERLQSAGTSLQVHNYQSLTIESLEGLLASRSDNNKT